MNANDIAFARKLIDQFTDRADGRHNSTRLDGRQTELPNPMREDATPPRFNRFPGYATCEDMQTGEVRPLWPIDPTEPDWVRKLKNLECGYWLSIGEFELISSDFGFEGLQDLIRNLSFEVEVHQDWITRSIQVRRKRSTVKQN